MLEHLLQSLLVHSHAATHDVKPHACQFIEVFLDHLDSQFHVLGAFLAAQLQQHALAQVASCDARWVERLHYGQHLIDLTGVHHIAIVKGHIVGDLCCRTAQVSVFLDIAHNGPSNDHLGFIQLQFAQLVRQVLGQRLLAHRRRGIVLIVTTTVVGKVTVPGHGVVIAVGLGIHLFVGDTVIVALIVIIVTARVIVIVVILLFLKCLNFIDLVVNELGHLGIVFLQHQSQQALLLQRQALSLFLLQCESLFCHSRKRFFKVFFNPQR